MSASKRPVTPSPAEPSPVPRQSDSVPSANSDFPLLKVNPLIEAVDELSILLQQEKQAYAPCENYLSVASSRAAKDGRDAPEVVSEGWRRKLCEWCFEVVDHFGFDREAVAIALNFLDRSVAAKSTSSGESIGKRDFQLFAVTSLYMALKIHGETDDPLGPRRKLRVDAFVELSRGFFQVDVIESTESFILDALQWRVNPPTCLRFVALLLRLCPRWTEASSSQAHANYFGALYDIARYLTELSVCMSTFSFNWKTSVVAYASILCGMDALQSKLSIPPDVRAAMLGNIESATGMHADDFEILKACAELKRLCPDLFGSCNNVNVIEHDISSMSSIGNGKISPVCVVEDNGYPRKRSRHTIDNNSSC